MIVKLAAWTVLSTEYTSRCRTDLSSAGETVLKIKDSSGSLVSPGYPYSSPAILCHWKIIVPKQHILELNVQDFELDCQSGSALKISEESEYCGSNKPKPTITSDEDLNIKLTVTVPQFRRGFRAKFSLTKRGACCMTMRYLVSCTSLLCIYVYIHACIY